MRKKNEEDKGRRIDEDQVQDRYQDARGYDMIRSSFHSFMRGSLIYARLLYAPVHVCITAVNATTRVSALNLLQFSRLKRDVPKCVFVFDYTAAAVPAVYFFFILDDLLC